MNLIVLDFPRADRCDASDWTTTVDAVIDAQRETKAATGVVASLGETMPEAVASRLIAEGIVPFCGIDEALGAIEISHVIHAVWERPAQAPLLSARQVETDIVSLYEDRAKPTLAAYGVNIPYGMVADNPEKAVAIAERLGYPVALKGLGIAHKSDVGAVRLNIRSAAEVLSAASAMAPVASHFLVEVMASKSVAELIVGAFRDPIVGPVMTLGAGGVLVDLLDDSAILLLPTSHQEIRDAIGGLRSSALIAGYRGGPRGDMNALVQLVASVADYVADNATRLEELDLNPVLVLPEGEGAIAVDAFIRTRS